MNPIIIVAGFVVLLALLLYYMYKEKAEAAPEKPAEPDVLKVRDYEAQRAAEKTAEAPVEPTEKPETPPAEPEPAEEAPKEPEAEPEAEPSEAEAEEPQPETATEDLEALEGVGEKYRALLRAAGIRSIAMLAGEEPDTLLGRLTETNDREGIVERLPSADEVEDWVQTAKRRGA